MSSSHSTITYTLESDIDGSPFGIDLADLEDDLEKDPFEEEELLAPVSSTPAVPDPTLSSAEENEPFKEDELLSLGTLADTTPLVASPPLPLSSARSDPIPEDDIPPQKRARFSSLSHRFEIRESFTAATARQYRFVLAQGAIDRLVVALEETDEYLGTRYKHDSHEMYVRI
ncbi:hypothetical protein Tco_0047988 [Tanacetum coccineum]